MTETARAAFDAQLAHAQSTLRRLQQLEPMLIDVSLREPCFSSYYGQTLQNKIELLPLIERFGFKDKIIATLDFQDPAHPQVENQFCAWLVETGYDMRGCFALTAVGRFGPDGQFVPDLSMRALVGYHIPNTMHEIYLMTPEASDHALVLRRIAASLAWLRQHMTGEHGGAPRIFMNLVDLMDAFYADPDWAAQVLALLAAQNVDAVSFEDGRGTFFPFQVGAMVRAAKALLWPAQKLLFHAHTGNGMENASVLEALLAGADGYWAGMEKQSSTIGHASMGELIANLLRAGNAHVARAYRVETLLPTCHAMHVINNKDAPPHDWPVQGSNAYRQMYSGFDQSPGRLMDLPPELIGARYTYRISPVGSDLPVIQGRVREVMGIAIDEACAKRMILLMRDDLNAGIRLRYDDPGQLEALYLRAM
ncbi:MAG: homocitrate synthase [Pseudomonadota bacterium]